MIALPGQPAGQLNPGLRLEVVVDVGQVLRFQPGDTTLSDAVFVARRGGGTGQGAGWIHQVRIGEAVEHQVVDLAARTPAAEARIGWPGGGEVEERADASARQIDDAARAVLRGHRHFERGNFRVDEAQDNIVVARGQGVVGRGDLVGRLSGDCGC
jgi:hypothetical protein